MISLIALAADEIVMSEHAVLGPIDPQIGLLRLDRLNGQPLAAVYNFACHPIQGVPSGGNTADIPAFASQVIEENLGDGVMAFFVQGCGGDINPVTYKAVNHPRDAEPLGHLVGDAIEQKRFGAEQAGATLPRAEQRAIEQNRRASLRHVSSVRVAARAVHRHRAQFSFEPAVAVFSGTSSIFSAAGVVISPAPLKELVPLYKTNRDEIVTQYDMVGLEKLGLLKMDFLGLTTLTIISDALKLIEKHRGVKLTVEELPIDDKPTYELVFSKALTSGVFQFESPGMRDVLRRYLFCPE